MADSGVEESKRAGGPQSESKDPEVTFSDDDIKYNFKDIKNALYAELAIPANKQRFFRNIYYLNLEKDTDEIPYIFKNFQLDEFSAERSYITNFYDNFLEQDVLNTFISHYFNFYKSTQNRYDLKEVTRIPTYIERKINDSHYSPLPPVLQPLREHYLEYRIDGMKQYYEFFFDRYYNYFDNFKIIKSQADGNCGIYSILYLICPNFRDIKLGSGVKMNKLLYNLSQIIKIYIKSLIEIYIDVKDDQEKTEFCKSMKFFFEDRQLTNDGINAFFINGEYLLDTDVGSIGLLYGFNIISICIYNELHMRPEDLIYKPTIEMAVLNRQEQRELNVIFILHFNKHFNGILVNDNFISYADYYDIKINYDVQYDIINTINSTSSQDSSNLKDYYIHILTNLLLNKGYLSLNENDIRAYLQSLAVSGEAETRDRINRFFTRDAELAVDIQKLHSSAARPLLSGAQRTLSPSRAHTPQSTQTYRLLSTAHLAPAVSLRPVLRSTKAPVEPKKKRVNFLQKQVRQFDTTAAYNAPYKTRTITRFQPDETTTITKQPSALPQSVKSSPALITSPMPQSKPESPSPFMAQSEPKPLLHPAPLPTTQSKPKLKLFSSIPFRNISGFFKKNSHVAPAPEPKPTQEPAQTQKTTPPQEPAPAPAIHFVESKTLFEMAKGNPDDINKIQSDIPLIKNYNKNKSILYKFLLPIIANIPVNKIDKIPLTIENIFVRHLIIFIFIALIILLTIFGTKSMKYSVKKNKWRLALGDFFTSVLICGIIFGALYLMFKRDNGSFNIKKLGIFMGLIFLCLFMYLLIMNYSGLNVYLYISSSNKNRIISEWSNNINKLRHKDPLFNTLCQLILGFLIVYIIYILYYVGSMSFLYKLSKANNDFDYKQLIKFVILSLLLFNLGLDLNIYFNYKETGGFMAMNFFISIISIIIFVIKQNITNN